MDRDLLLRRPMSSRLQLRATLRHLLIAAVAAAPACGGAVESTSGGTSSGGTSSSTSSSGSPSCGETGPVDVTGLAPECRPSWVSGGPTCGGHVDWPCGAPTPIAGTALGSCAARCPSLPGAFNCPTISSSGTAPDEVVQCNLDHTGRRPAGFAPRHDVDLGVAALLGRAAALEAASIDASEILAVELAHHGAPMDLVDAALQAAREETTHARVVGDAARRFGADDRLLDPGSIVRTAPRSLEAIAIENAREGCVRETFGVACALGQAARAGDPGVRAMMGCIAEDELGHAALAWSVAAWIEEQLDEPARARVAAAREDAIDLLCDRPHAESPEDARQILGLASGHESAALARHLRATLWSASAGAGSIEAVRLPRPECA